MGQTFITYILDATGESSVRAVAMRAGIEPSTLIRQLKASPSLTTVRAICRSYNLPLLPAFTAAGFITEAEAASMAASAGLAHYPAVELAEELARRFRRAGPPTGQAPAAHYPGSRR